MTESVVIDEYVVWLRSWGASPATIKARRELALSRIREWGMDGFTVANLQRYLARDSIRSEWSRATYYSNFKDFCTWAVAAGYMAENPFDSELLKSPTRPRSRPRPLSEREVARVEAAAKGNVRLFIMLGLYAGLRASEIAKIRGEDITAEGIFVMGKGNKAAIIPCHPEIARAAEKMPSGYWFTRSDGVNPMRAAVVSFEVTKLFRELGIQGSSHRCRHTYGTRLLRAGVNVRKVQKLMRHETLETTALYTAIDEEELSAAINLLPPSSAA